MSCPYVIFISCSQADSTLPRKLLRKLHGKKVIDYAVSLAKSLAAPNRIIVLADDEEFELLHKEHGIHVHLFKTIPSGFNDPAVLDLLQANCRELGKPSHVIWLSSNSPLLSLQSVKDGISSLISSKAAAVYTLSEAPECSWEYTDTYQPYFRRKENNQHNPLHREVSGFFIMDISSIGHEGYMGQKAIPYLLKNHEALEINTPYDFWVAEKLLAKRKIIFVVAAYPEIGLGHVYRVLSIAHELIGHEIQLIFTAESEHFVNLAVGQGYQVVVQPKDSPLADFVLSQSPDVVINDLLNTSLDYIQTLKTAGVSVINFEDQGEGAKFADLVINALYGEALHENVVIGPDYFDLRDEFINHPPVSIREQVGRVLITFGGADHRDLTLFAIKSLLPVAKKIDFKLCVVTGAIYEHANNLKRYLDNLPEGEKSLVEWSGQSTKKMSHYMAISDLAITSAGRTVYELAALHLPAIVIASNDRETTHVFSREAGFLYLGRFDQVFESELIRAVKQLLPIAGRDQIRHKLAKIKLGNGLQNIVNKLEALI